MFTPQSGAIEHVLTIYMLSLSRAGISQYFARYGARISSHGTERYDKAQYSAVPETRNTDVTIRGNIDRATVW